ncbi:MAG: outer membrane lipoprotein carrier protein LolA [Syntrophobacteraceae bacterium]|nr:outer membrane lipoprotein carrier protein LolA [Syntrophobacteraceae bacterium]
MSEKTGALDTHTPTPPQSSNDFSKGNTPILQHSTTPRPRSRRRAWLALAASCSLVLTALTSGADDGKPAEGLQAALEGWSSELGQISSISSDFTQEKHMALFQDVLTIQGRMFVETNGLFAWETRWPVRYKMVVADGRILQWDEETDRLQTITMRDNPAAAAIFEQMSSWFSGQYASLSNTYNVSLAAAQPVSFLFTPRKDSPLANYLAFVQVWLRGDGLYLDKVRISESSGDSTDIIYSNTVLNQTIPAEAWDVRHITTDILPDSTAPARAQVPPAARRPSRPGSSPR